MYLFAEALAEGAVKMGMPSALAHSIASQTVLVSYTLCVCMCVCVCVCVCFAVATPAALEHCPAKNKVSHSDVLLEGL